MPNHVVYVMDVYPHQQFASQDCTQIQGKNFEVFLIWDRPLIRPGLPLLQQAIQECLRQPFSSFAADTAVGNWLYEMSKRLLFSLEEERLGVNRAMALHEYLSGKQWHDLHKGLALIGKSLGPEPIDYQKVPLGLNLSIIKRSSCRSWLSNAFHGLVRVQERSSLCMWFPRLLTMAMLHHDCLIIS
jgi:hypothetical protein